MLLILSVIWSDISAANELSCGDVLNKCTTAVSSQKETIRRQGRLIKTQRARIKLSDNRIEELEEDVNLYKKTTGTSLFIILLMLL